MVRAMPATKPSSRAGITPSPEKLAKNARWKHAPRSVPVSEGGGGPHLKRVVFQPIPDNTSRFAALTGYSFSRGPCSTCKISLAA